MAVLRVILDPALERALVEAARREVRTPAQQAVFILRQALLERRDQPLSPMANEREEADHAA